MSTLVYILFAKYSRSLLKHAFAISGFIAIGIFFDVGVWYFVKNVKIFDEEIELEDIAEEPGETH